MEDFDWLGTTRKIQTSTYGRDPADLEGEELREFIRWNFLASHAELTEALEETVWKPWANYKDGEPVIPDVPAFLSEIIDSQMFLANMLVAAGVTDEDYVAAYHEKWRKNVARQERAGGYDSRRGVDKCIICRRSFDDVGRYDTGTRDDICTKCGEATFGKIDA